MGQNYKELKIWSLTKQIGIDVSLLTQKFPVVEIYELESQFILSREVQILNEEYFQKIMAKIDALKKLRYLLKSNFTMPKTLK